MPTYTVRVRGEIEEEFEIAAENEDAVGEKAIREFCKYVGLTEFEDIYVDLVGVVEEPETS